MPMPSASIDARQATIAEPRALLDGRGATATLPSRHPDQRHRETFSLPYVGLVLRYQRILIRIVSTLKTGFHVDLTCRAFRN
jgi:hypothetical protein